MILLRARILGFGKLRETEFDFRSGLNVVYAANEGGKSTLQRFLVGMLYGQLRSDLKVQRRLDSWVEQYKPWHSATYGGILWCRLTDERELEIQRSFGKDETRIEIRTSSGEEITRQYEQQRNGEVLFARAHFGMPKELFESVGMIRENRASEMQGHENIRDRIANLAQSGDEELSVRQSLARLQERLEALGSDRAPTKPYKQLKELVQALRDERRACDERRVQFRTWTEERNRIVEEIRILERDLAGAQKALLSARRREVAERIHTLEEIEHDRALLRSAIESLGARIDFPIEGLEELNQLVGARDSVAERLHEIRLHKEKALELLAKSASELREFEAYASFVEGNDAEKITEWFVNYLSLSLQKDGLQRTVNRLGEEIGALETRVNEITSAFTDPERDWERVAREAAEDEQAAMEAGSSLAGRTASERTNLAVAQRGALVRRTGAGLSLAAAIAAMATFLGGISPFPASWHFGTGGALIVTAILLWIISMKSAHAGQTSIRLLKELEKELATIRESGGKKRRELNEEMKIAGFEKLDDFLAAAKKSQQDRQKLIDLRERLQETGNQRERLLVQLDEVYTLLKDGLAKVNISCSPGSLKFQIDLLRANMRKFREVDAQHSVRFQESQSLGTKESELAREYDLKSSRIESLLRDAGVDSPEGFREECAKRQKLLDLSEKEASRTREFRRVAGAMTLHEWKERLQELTNQEGPAAAEDATPAESLQDRAAQNRAADEPFLPYLPSIAECEELERGLARRLANAEQEHARIIERLNQAFQNVRPSSEIDEDLAVAERDFAEMEKNRSALEIALETIEKLSRQQQEVLAPQLNAAVEQRFLRLCGSRYEEVKVDPDFQVWVRELQGGALRLAEHLSRGTQDQLYFSLRFGVLDLISNPDEPCPGFLDEPFAAYDQERMNEAFQVLLKEAERRQLLLFTCREDLLGLALRHQGHIIRLDQQRLNAATAG